MIAMGSSFQGPFLISRAQATSVSQGRSNPSPAEELGERERSVGLPLASEQNERRENGLSFLEAHVDLSAKAAVPAQRGSREPLRRLSRSRRSSRGFGQTDVLEFGRGGESLGDVATVEGAAEAHER
jgi:hypothetical protein